jgi:hypothetical protein
MEPTFFTERGDEVKPRCGSPGAVTVTSPISLEVKPIQVGLTIHLRYALLSQIQSTGGYSCLTFYTSIRTGKKEGFQGTCYLIGWNRSLHRLRSRRYLWHVQRWYHRSGNGRDPTNDICYSQDGHRDHKGVLRFMPSTEGGRRRDVRLDEELRCEHVPFTN